MTVRDLLEHFSIYPNRVDFYDTDKNDTSTIDIFSSSCGVNAYNEFVSEYGDRIVEEWKWQVDDSIYIQFVKEEDEMIDLKKKYALLEDGSVEPLHFENGEPRDAFQDEDGKCYLVHDRLIRINGANSIALRYSRIIATANDIKEFEEQKNDNTSN